MYIQLDKMSNRMNKVRELRRSLDLTQDQLAERLNAGRSYVSFLEKNRLADPSLARARLIADALHSTVEDVFPEVKK